MDALGGEKRRMYESLLLYQINLECQVFWGGGIYQVVSQNSFFFFFLKRVNNLQELQVLNAAQRQKQLGYSDRCHSSSKKGQRAWGHLEAGRPHCRSEHGPQVDGHPASGSQLPADLFRAPLLLIFPFLPVIAGACTELQ